MLQLLAAPQTSGGLTKQTGKHCLVCLWQAHKEQWGPQGGIKVGPDVLVELWAIYECYDGQRWRAQLGWDLVHC
jgi:hypothetical protein